MHIESEEKKGDQFINYFYGDSLVCYALNNFLKG